MKHTIIGMTAMAVLSLTFAVPAYADCGHCGMSHGAGKGESQGPKADWHLEKLTKKLQLTEAQQAQVKPILAEKNTRMEQVRTETHEKIKAVLTDDQRAKFDDMKAKGPGHEGCGCPACDMKDHGRSKGKKKS